MHCLSTPSISQDAAALFANQQSGNLEPTCRELPWQRTRSMKRLPFRRTALSNKNMMLIVALSGLVLFFYTFHSILTGVPPIYDHDYSDRRAEIADAFQHAWNGYSKYCFGHDTLRPVSNTCENDFGGWGATAIDSLSTAIILGNEEVAQQILQFIADLNFNIVHGNEQVQVFETTIRHFGGMISAWDLLDGPFSHMAIDSSLRRALYDQMVTLGDKLSCSFNSPSGVPHDWVNPTTCETDSGTNAALTGAGTMILEFARLSAITGNQTYAALAERAESYLFAPSPPSKEPFPGLIGHYINTNDGSIQDASGSWGAYSDSFYEYLIKAYIYNSSKYKLYLDRWLLAADSTIRYIGSHPYGHPEWTLLSTWSGTSLTKSMETLSWFSGGNIILGGMVTGNQTLVNYGLSIADTAGAVYNMTKTGLGGEFVTWNTDCDGSESCDADNSMKTTVARYQLRPEVLETWYYAYRATRNTKYVDWAWSAFQAINKTCRTDSGFSSISNVNAADGGGKIDKQESFVFAEVLKYLYLIHATDKDMPYHVQDSRTGKKNTWVFNTEAHPLLVVGPTV